MLRGYRSIVVALVGLASIGAGEPTKRPEQSQKQLAQGELAKAAATVSAAISRIQIPVEQNPRCERGKDNRDSDLCAQWKAADAARDAARFALAGLLVGIVGTIMLVWTFVEQRRTSRAQLRAYMSIEPEKMLGFPDKPSAQICMRNAGSTPAHGVKFSLVGRVDDPDLDDAAIKVLMGRIVASDDNDLFMSAQQKLFRHLPIGQFTPAGAEACRQGRRWLYVVGRVDYTDVFERRRHTWFCHIYFGANMRGGIHRFGNKAD